MTAAPNRVNDVGLFRYYRFHGLHITVSADDVGILDAIHSRFRHFSVDDRLVAPDLSFEFQYARGLDEHIFKNTPIGARPVYDSPSGEVLYSDAEDRIFMSYGEEVKGLCSPKDGYARISILESVKDKLWLLSHPFVTLPFIELLKRRQLFNIHASGLCVDGRGILFPGNSGSGKSTLALALLRAGFGFLGDDMLFLTPSDDALHVLAFPDEIDVTEQTVHFFSELEHILHEPLAAGWPKRQILAEQAYESHFVKECIPEILVFPKIANAPKSKIGLMSPDEALLELAPNILLTEACSSQSQLDTLAALTTQCVCYRLETGQDFDAIPELIKDMMA